MDASRRLWPRSDLRVGDADRRVVVDELQRHYIEGRLTSDELGERVSHALDARTFADLASLLTDLPALVDPEAAEAPPALGTYGQSDPWQGTHLPVPPIGVVLMLVGLVLMLMIFAMPNMRFGFFPWPLLIWGFFFIGRPHRGGRGRF